MSGRSTLLSKQCNLYYENLRYLSISTLHRYSTGIAESHVLKLHYKYADYNAVALAAGAMAPISLQIPPGKYLF